MLHGAPQRRGISNFHVASREKAVGGAATTWIVCFERQVVNLLFLQPLVCNISIFSLYLVDFLYVISIPSLRGEKHGLLRVSENENFIVLRKDDKALRDIYPLMPLFYLLEERQ
jgi:hypothetical protein